MSLGIGETAGFAAVSGAMSAGLGYVLNGTKLIDLKHPFQGGIHGTVVAVIIGISLELFKEMNDNDSAAKKNIAWFGHGCAFCTGN